MYLHLSANARLTRQLAIQQAQRQTQSVSLTPKAMTWGQWWNSWQNEALLSGELAPTDLPTRVLNGFEALFHWQAFVRKWLENPLLNEQQTAQQLYQAWCLTEEYGEGSSPLAHEEGQLFEVCRQAYRRLLTEQGWADEVSLMQQRLAWFEQGIGSCPQQVEWHGFDEFTPFMQRWQAALDARGVPWLAVTPPNVGAVSSLYAAADERDELQQAAAFCVHQLAQALAQGQDLATIRIGIVAPDVGAIKSALCFWLDDQLFQQFDQPLLAAHSSRRLYNVSLGQALPELPLIDYVLQTLTLAFNPDKSLPYDDWSRWLTHGLGPGSLAERQAMDREMRRLQWAWIKWSQLEEVERLKRVMPSSLKQRLAQMRALTLETYVDLEGFMAQVAAALKDIDWSRTAGFNSDLKQQHTKFNEVLAQFACFSALKGKLSLQAWLSWLQTWCAQNVHQSQSKWVQPIQVMGMLESGGQTFDALWVLGLDDEAWPRAPKPNRCLPLAWQRERNMPRCDADRELAYARQLTQRLRQSSARVVWSYAKQKGDALALPSPLLAEVAQQDYAPLVFSSVAHQAWLLKQTQGLALEWVLDAQAPPIALGEKVRGGTGILSAQRKCPLMAFFDYRLGAKYGLEQVEDGLASTDQGTIIHAVLQAFWQQVKSQAALLAMDEHALHDLLSRLITSALEPMQTRFSATYLALEQQRILRLLHDWLALEKARPYSFKVTETEWSVVLELAGICFQVSLDRVDDTDEGRLIIDYKTGQATVQDLLKQPLHAPQLAVYLHQVNDKLAGLGYGLLHSDRGVSWSMLTEQGQITAKNDKNWQKISEKGEWEDWPWTAFIEHLRDEVTELARQIQQGEAPMRFENEADLAYAAALLALRLPEARLQLGVSDTEEMAESQGESV